MAIRKMNVILLLILVSLFSFVSRGQNNNVGEKTLLLTDSVRNRIVKTELWYPTGDCDSAGIRKTELPFILDPTIRDATPNQFNNRFKKVD